MIKVTMQNGYEYHCKGIGREPGNVVVLLLDSNNGLDSVTIFPEQTPIARIEFSNGMVYNRIQDEGGILMRPT